MKKIILKSIKDKSYGKLSDESLKKVVGGYTLNTVTVTPSSLTTSSGADDGDDGITND